MHNFMPLKDSKTLAAPFRAATNRDPTPAMQLLVRSCFSWEGVQSLIQQSEIDAEASV